VWIAKGEAVINAARRGEGQGVRAAWQDLLGLSEAALSVGGSTSRREEEMTRRLRRMEGGQPPAPAPDAGADEEDERPAADSQAAVDEVIARARRVHAALEAGSVTRAAAALEQEPLVRWTPEVHEKLQALHPEEAEQPPAPEDAAPPAAVTMEQLGEVVRHLKQGKAAGPSGMTYEHVTAAAAGSDEGMSVLLELVNLMLSGSLPHCPELTDCRLVAVAKPNGGVRPIAIGEVLVRIASLCALAVCGGAGAEMAPEQLGVGVSGGAEAMGHALRAAIAAEPDAVLVQIDFANAFNTMLRKELIGATRARTPSLERYVTWLYGRHARLFVEGAPPGTAPIMSQRGVRQGDPLGPMLWANGLQASLTSAIAAAPSTAGIAVHDDAVLHGAPEDVQASLEKLEELTAPLGLCLRLDKCAVYSPNAEAAAQLAAQIGMQHAKDGIVAAGSPIGTEDFVIRYVEKRTSAVRAAVARLRELQGHLPAQDALLLLRCSLSGRLTFLQRVVPAAAPLAPDHPVMQAHQATADDIAAAALAFMGLQDHAALPDGTIAQLQAPLRDGGFGMYSCHPEAPATAYLSSAALAQRALQAASPRLQPFSAEAQGPLIAIWTTLRERHPCLAADTPAQPDMPAVCSDLPSLQNKVARRIADDAAAAAIAAAPQPRQATLRSAACHAASAWLTAKPTCYRLKLDDKTVCAAARRRLGISAMPAGALHARCACGKPSRDLGPEHALNCSSTKGLVVDRHDAISKALKRALVRAGVSASLEPHLAPYGGAPTAAQRARRRFQRGAEDEVDEARGDVLCVLDGEPAVIDVSVTNVLSTTLVAAAASRDGAAAAKRDEEKRKAYADRGDSGYKFTPFSVESLGRVGKPALTLLSKIGRRAAECSMGVFSSRQFVDGVLQEVSVILNCYNARMECAVAGHVMRPPGREWTRPARGAVPSCDVGDGL
jgi:hypothetical protein